MFSEINSFHDSWGLLLHIHEKEKPMLDLAPASGQLWQLPFDNYDDKLVYVKEGSVIKIGDDELQIRFTPGHSPGHIIFYSEADGFAIMEMYYSMAVLAEQICPGGDFNTLINSIQTQLFTLPDDTKIYPGHGPMTTIGF